MLVKEKPSIRLWGVTNGFAKAVNKRFKIIRKKNWAEQINIKIIGLMGMGSLDMNKNESEFIEISNFYQKSKDRFNFKYLSLGMSGDYNLAIENNSNMIRVGSLIFGERN